MTRAPQRSDPLTAAGGSTAPGTSAGAAELKPPKPSSCLSGQLDKTVPIAPKPGRDVFCGIDLGSNNVKLSVVSMEPGQPRTVRSERECKRKLGLGALVFDAATATAKALDDAQQGHLIETIQEFKAICALDRGTLVGVDSTQWSRDALNFEDVAERVTRETGLVIDRLSPEQEGQLGYVAGSLGADGKLVIDPGSNSFQLSWKLKGSDDIRTVSIPFGYVRGSTVHMETAATYAEGQLAYGAHVRALIDEALVTRTPVADRMALAALAASGALDRELLVIGQDGAGNLAVRGHLVDRQTGRWVDTSEALDRIVADAAANARVDEADGHGLMVDEPIAAPELRLFLQHVVGPSDFEALTTMPIGTGKGLYGAKALVVPALLEVLMTDLDLGSAVLVPQEMTLGFILWKLGMAPATPAGTTGPVAEPPAPASGPDAAAQPSYGELAAQRSVSAFDAVVAKAGVLGRDARPEDPAIKAFRKLLMKLRDQLDLFAHAYGRGEQNEKTWRRLRANIDEGYELVGAFKDLFDSQGLVLAVIDPATNALTEGVRPEELRYSRDELKTRKKRLLAWSEAFFRPEVLEAARAFLAAPGDRPYKVRREDLSEFFWGGVDVEPREELGGLGNIARLSRAQFERALDTLKEIDDVRDLTEPAREEVFHDLRKRMRSANNVLVQFPELVRDAERVAGLQDKLMSFVTEYGAIEDKLVAFHLESGDDAKKLKKRINQDWKKLRERQRDEDLDDVLRELRRSVR